MNLASSEYREYLTVMGVVENTDGEAQRPSACRIIWRMKG